MEKFVAADQLKALLAQSREDLSHIFEYSDLDKGEEIVVACAVCDPLAHDCPLVYISEGFANLTGYNTAFATGRSCRFLQPISAVINDAFNLGERKKMREFCVNIQPVGTTIGNLLLNER